MNKEVLNKITALHAKVEALRAGWKEAEEARIRFGEDDTRVDASEIAGDFDEIGKGLVEIRELVEAAQAP